jgi:rhamnogalacturonyl hydrolase YesR
MEATNELPSIQSVALQRFFDRVYRREPEELNTGWEDLLVAEGLSLIAESFADERARDWTNRWAEYHLGVPIEYEERYIPSFTREGERLRGLFLYDYCGNWGLPVVEEAVLDGDLREKHTRAAIEVGRHIIDGSSRGANGVILHGGFAEAVWVDTLYYTAPPLAKVCTLTGEPRFGEEAIKQCLLHAEILRDERTGLFFHDCDPTTGVRTANFWSRGNGWIIMALAAVLEKLDSSFAGYAEVAELYRSLAEGLLRYRHASGMWRLIPEDAETPLETSGTAMIVSGLLAGVRLGVLESNLGLSLRRSFDELLTWIQTDRMGDAPGALMGSQKPAGRGGWEIHKTVGTGECTYATGSFLKLLAELKKGGLL